MSEFFSIAPILFPAIAISYVLGAVPIAMLISRRNGVDIFSVGTGLAGASNVRRNVGNKSGGLVLLGDITKGMLAIFFSRQIGLDGLWMMVPALAVVSGHWKSVFTGFRGGDGLATLGGIILALFMVYGFIVVVIATIVALGGQRLPYTSLLSVVVGYATLLFLSVNYYGDVPLTLGIGGVAVLVFAHASLGHLRRRDGEEWDGEVWDDMDDSEGRPKQKGV